MGKKLAEIEEKINLSSKDFQIYLKSNIDSAVYDKIDGITKETSVYIFSGIIRNFFLKRDEIRDLDIVLEDEIDIESYFRGCEISRNSFGGYKIVINNTPIDLWYLKDTWAFNNCDQLDFGFELAKKMPGTAFFNSSAIIYLLNEKEFFTTKEFVRFLKDKTLDIVHEKNPNYPLCVVNSIYYSEKYKLRLSLKLKKFLKDKVKLYNDFERVQMKHFGTILYSNNQIEEMLSKMEL